MEASSDGSAGRQYFTDHDPGGLLCQHSSKSCLRLEPGDVMHVACMQTLQLRAQLMILGVLVCGGGSVRERML